MIYLSIITCFGAELFFPVPVKCIYMCLIVFITGNKVKLYMYKMLRVLRLFF